jgi:hypothetical protein
MRGCRCLARAFRPPDFARSTASRACSWYTAARTPARSPSTRSTAGSPLGEINPAMYVDNLPAIASGREIGAPGLYVDSDTLVGTLDYGTLRGPPRPWPTSTGNWTSRPPVRNRARPPSCSRSSPATTGPLVSANWSAAKPDHRSHHSRRLERPRTTAAVRPRPGAVGRPDGAGDRLGQSPAHRPHPGSARGRPRLPRHPLTARHSAKGCSERRNRVGFGISDPPVRRVRRTVPRTVLPGWCGPIRPTTRTQDDP